jgi:UDP-glucose 4-epimerase
VLLTGGAGYLGSHIAVELLMAGWAVTVLDNLRNSSPVAIERAQELGGGPISLHVGDIRDAAALDRALAEARPDSVIHLAGLKAVEESIRRPLAYYDNNVVGTATLLEAMERHDVRDIVFSSSATVYGEPERIPLTEDCRLGPVNPYGRTKLHIEEMLRDLVGAGGGWRAILLRYFNPVGAHPSGRLGEDPAGIPTNLLPIVMQVAVGRRDRVQVFGDDYPTADGTCIRDYIHVVDLARGHVAALDALERIDGCQTLNLGTGHGSSVRQVIQAASGAAGRDLPFEMAPRRPGDVAECWADPSQAEALLGWRSRLTLADACRDAWTWQSTNPDGYPEPAAPPLTST